MDETPTETLPSEAELRQQRIATVAYYRAARRGFAPGCELEDWLAAEQEIDAEGAKPPA